MNIQEIKREISVSDCVFAQIVSGNSKSIANSMRHFGKPIQPSYLDKMAESASEVKRINPVKMFWIFGGSVIFNNHYSDFELIETATEAFFRKLKRAHGLISTPAQPEFEEKLIRARRSLEMMLK